MKNPLFIPQEGKGVRQMTAAEMAEDSVDLFTHGYCYEFAVALHELTGFSLMRVVLKSWGGVAAETAHAFVKSNRGQGVDAHGVHSYAEILAEQERELPASNGYYEIRPATVKMYESATGKHGLDASFIQRAKDCILESPTKYGISNSKTAAISDSTLYPEFADYSYVFFLANKIHRQSEFDEDFTERFDSDYYQLKDVPISSLEKENDLDEYTIDDLGDQYAKLTTPAPPIILNEHGEILDGLHRTCAAIQRGESTIKAYVPCSKAKAEGKTASISPSDSTLYHGTNTEKEFDTLKPTGGDPVIWLGELDTAKDIYSRTIRGGRERVFEVKLKPDAKIADLLDESQPITQKVRNYFLRIVGYKLHDHAWSDVMNYVAFHNHDRVLIPMLSEAGFSGAIVMDKGRPPGGTSREHHSVALWDMDAIESQQEMKTASLNKYYHNTDVMNRESVQKNGLLTSMSDSAQLGGYGSIFFHTKLTPERSIDTWEADLTGYDIEPDETTDISGNPDYDGDSWWVIYDDVPPERLKLVTKGKMLTAAGATPMIMYHGTNEPFSKVDMRRGAQGVFWLTSDLDSLLRGERGACSTKYVLRCAVTIKNPAGWDEYEKKSLGELKRDYDGVILPDSESGSFDAIVFKPSQVKILGQEKTAAQAYHKMATWLPLDEVNVINIPLTSLIPDEEARDPRAIASLVEKIKSSGRIDPIEVNDMGDGTYFIEDGTHRYYAAQKLGINELPAHVRGRSKNASEDTEEKLKQILKKPWKKQTEEERRFVAQNDPRQMSLPLDKSAARRPKYQTYTPDTRTFSDNFMKWFEGSKVVDRYGNPLIVWHGSPDLRWLKETGVFQTVKEKHVKHLNPERQEEAVKERAYFFAGDHATAASYADDHRAFDYQAAVPGTRGFYLCLKNPMEVNNKSRKWQGTDDTVSQAKAAGHDGVIIYNTIDNYQVDSHKVTDVYIAFHPNQIKAVEGNSGEYSSDNHSVYASKTAAATASPDELPPTPGTKPIPPMTVRLYHYTKSYDNLASIKAQGLLSSMGRGDGGTGPSEASAGIWASTKAPADYHLFVEFYASSDQISHRAQSPEGKWEHDKEGKWGKQPITQADLDEWVHSGEKHVILNGDVPPSQFLAIHEPWHHHARYMLDMTDAEWNEVTWLHDPAEVEKLEHKWNSPDEAKALAYVQKVKGVMKAAAVTPNDHTLYHGTNAEDEFDALTPNAYGIIWLAEENSARDYSYSHYKKGRRRLYEVHLKPNAVIVDLRKDIDNPFVKQCMQNVESIQKNFHQGKMTPELWYTYADFGLIEGYPWVVKLAKEMGIDAIIVNDTSEAYSRHENPAHDSIAVLNPNIVESMKEIESDQLKTAAQKGVRFIDGQEYLLAGRVTTREKAIEHVKQLRKAWNKVRAIKLNDWDYMLYVHDEKVNKTAASDEEERAEALKYPNEHEYLKHHYTGEVPSDAYSRPGMFNWQKLKHYPKLLKTITLKDGRKVDLRQEGTKNQYLKMVTVTENNTAGNPVERQTHARDEKGDLIHLTDEEVKEKGYPVYDTAIMAFNEAGECVAQASDEWGADLVAVRPDYQKQGLGTIMLTEFRRQFKKVRQMGQMTPAGTALNKSYYRSLTGKEPTPTPPTDSPEQEARRAVWRFLGNVHWENWKKFTQEQADQLHEFENEADKDNVDAVQLLKKVQDWVKAQPLNSFSSNAEKALDTKTAYQEIEMTDKAFDLIGGILETDEDLEAWAEMDELPQKMVKQRLKFLKLFKGMKIAVIDDMRVYKKGKGAGSRLLEAFVNKAKLAGCAAVILEAGIFREQEAGFDLVQWYERHGFQTKGFRAELPLMVRWLKNVQGKTAAPRSIWYHGSPYKNLRSIIAQGLVPDVKKREWQDDPDAGLNNPSRQSIGGCYVTTNLSTACGAPRDTGYYGPGRMVLVAMELQPNTMYLDEDDVNFTNLINACPHLSDPSYHAPGYYLALTQPHTPPNWKEAIEEIRGRYIDECMNYWKYKFESDNHAMHPELEKRFRELLPSTWEAALTRQTAHAVARMKDYDVNRVYRNIFPDTTTVPTKEQLFPTIAQGEQAWRNASEQLTRSLKSKARINPDKANFRDTARIESPIGFNGSNRIIAVAEIREGHQWRGPDDKGPVKIIMHYGTLPADFFKQWKERKGSEVTVLKAGEEDGGAVVRAGFSEWIAAK